MAKDLSQRLRMEIKEQLSRVTRINSPLIWEAIHTPQGELNPRGYQIIEARLVYKIISGHLAPAAAIPQLEAEMDDL